MGETTQTDGPCGHDGRDFTAYSMNDLDGTEARRVETQAATCDRCWTELMSLTRIWTNVSRVLAVGRAPTAHLPELVAPPRPPLIVEVATCR